mgnify:CR=1 FL=1
MQNNNSNKNNRLRKRLRERIRNASGETMIAVAIVLSALALILADDDAEAALQSVGAEVVSHAIEALRVELRSWLEHRFAQPVEELEADRGIPLLDFSAAEMLRRN